MSLLNVLPPNTKLMNSELIGQWNAVGVNSLYIMQYSSGVSTFYSHNQTIMILLGFKMIDAGPQGYFYTKTGIEPDNKPGNSRTEFEFTYGNYTGFYGRPLRQTMLFTHTFC